MIKRLLRIIFGISVLATILLLTGCATSTRDSAPNYYVDVSKIPNAVPKKLPRSAYGNPSVYVVEGRRYHVLASSYGYFKRGVASWYGTKFHGRMTSSREPYDVYGMTAASTDLPIPSFVRVTNLANHKSVIVKVNDRGPFASNRIIDLSYAAAMKLGYANRGTAWVEVQAINVGDKPHHTYAHHHYGVRPIRVAAVSTPIHSRVYLQLGAFRDFSNASYTKTRIQELVHKPVVILKGLSHQIPLYRVLVGPVISGESNRLSYQLQKLGFHKIMMVAN